MTTTITFNQQQIDALRVAISQNQQQGVSTATFCANWDSVKLVLETLKTILAMVPGVGIFAGPAIAVVIAAGDAAKRALCP